MIVNGGRKYITYGISRIVEEYIPSIDELSLEPDISGKIDGAFWGSPVSAEYGWEDFCRCEGIDIYEMPFVEWYTKVSANILLVNEDTIDEVPVVWDEENERYCIDYQKLVDEGVDAIEFDSDHGTYYDNKNVFRYWDCDSIMVINKDILDYY